MTRPELIQTFQKMASEIAEKDFSGVNEEATIASLGIDSLGMLEIVGSLEKEFKVTIPDDKLVGISTVSQLVDLVHKGIPQAAK